MSANLIDNNMHARQSFFDIDELEEMLNDIRTSLTVSNKKILEDNNLHTDYKAAKRVSNACLELLATSELNDDEVYRIMVQYTRARFAQHILACNKYKKKPATFVAYAKEIPLCIYNEAKDPAQVKRVLNADRDKFVSDVTAH